MDGSIVGIVVILLFSIVVHEYSHARMAMQCGDPTAKIAGRLTLNPIPHIDPIGTIIVPVFLFWSGFTPFGWAKPVPVNPANFNNPGIDNVKVSGAGPLSNILLACLFTFLTIISFPVFQYGFVYGILQWGIQINVLLAVFNLIPISPLDGSHILEYFIPQHMKQAYNRFQMSGPLILMIIIFSGFILPFSLFFMIIGPPFYFLLGIFQSVIDIFI